MNHVGLLLSCFLLALVHARAVDHTALYVQVICGTDQEKPASSHYREIGPKLRAKLGPVFRWKHYWETERKKVHVDPAKVTKVQLANQRTLEIEKLKSGDMEVRLFRRTGLITKSRQQVNARMHILGGEDSSKDSFFVVVRPDEPMNGE